MRTARTALVLAALTGSLAWGATTPPRTLVSAPAAIGGTAQHGGQIAWFVPCGGIRVRVLATGRDVVAGLRLAGPCESPPDGFAIGAGRVLWINTTYGNTTYANVFSAAPGETHTVLHEEVLGDTAVNAGNYVSGAAGDGALLVYAVLSRFTSDACFYPEEMSEPCEYGVSGGRVLRIVGRRGVRVPGVPPAALIAAGAGRIAIVTVARTSARDVLDQTGIEVRNGFTGQLVVRLAPAGEIEELALSRTVLAALVRKGGALRLERYGLPDGRLLGATRVLGNATDLSVSAAGVVFRTGRAIRITDLRSGRTRVLARPPTASSVSIEGRRVIWIEGRRVRTRDV